METIAVQPVDALTVTMLVDNLTDPLLATKDRHSGPPWRPSQRMPARFLAGGHTDDALRAEHGFSALVTIATGMHGLVGELGRPNMPVLIHPEFWTRRRLAFPGRDRVELPTTSKTPCRARASRLSSSASRPPARRRTAGDRRDRPYHGTRTRVSGARGAPRDAWQPDPLILDDQALIATVRRHGLVVLTGCGHSGIVNILPLRAKDHRREPHPRRPRGFHLSGPAFEPIIGPTCNAFAEFSPDFLVPAHCTGWAATHATRRSLPGRVHPKQRRHTLRVRRDRRLIALLSP